MRLLDSQQIVLLHQEILQATGGLDGLRDIRLLESALAAPFLTFDGTDLYPSALDKIVHLVFGIVQNHPFLDGNKRIGVMTMLIMLEENGFSINFADDELIWLGLGIADHRLMPQDVLTWLLEKQNED